MDIEAEIRAWKAQRRRMLMTMDTTLGRALIQQGHGASPTEDVILTAMHKARYEVPDIPDELRHESREWLESRGHDRLSGIPWPPKGKLPRGDGSVL